MIDKGFWEGSKQHIRWSLLFDALREVLLYLYELKKHIG